MTQSFFSEAVTIEKTSHHYESQQGVSKQTIPLIFSPARRPALCAVWNESATLMTTATAWRPEPLPTQVIEMYAPLNWPAISSELDLTLVNPSILAVSAANR
jgi:hypothetical protein